MKTADTDLAAFDNLHNRLAAIRDLGNSLILLTPELAGASGMEGRILSTIAAQIVEHAELATPAR